MQATDKNTLLNLRQVSKSFHSADGAPRLVLDRVDFTLAEGEIVALLGKSGSGKSTLLRIIAGLIPLDRGSYRYRDRDIHGPASGIAMVFQSFALFPWLTVQQNVELGLEAQGVPQQERTRRSDALLDMIGLAGFLGALTGETLRDDILDLWEKKRIPTLGILIVSHNIEEAVMMADRIVILSSG